MIELDPKDFVISTWRAARHGWCYKIVHIPTGLECTVTDEAGSIHQIGAMAFERLREMVEEHYQIPAILLTASGVHGACSIGELKRCQALLEEVWVSVQPGSTMERHKNALQAVSDYMEELCKR